MKMTLLKRMSGFFSTIVLCGMTFGSIYWIKDGRFPHFWTDKSHEQSHNDSQDNQSEDATDEFRCSTLPSISGLDQSEDLSLARLNQLQELCNSYATNTEMIFTYMPESNESAVSIANDLSNVLLEFSKYGVRPLVIVEPVTDSGLVNYSEFANGKYNAWLDVFFSTLKDRGIADSQMGIWVPFPEANLPIWDESSTPALFGTDVNIYSNTLKKYFPTVPISILLNSTSYESSDLSWENGTDVSLVPYLENIEKGLVSSFGIQGFPWRSPANADPVKYVYDPKDFLKTDITIEAARYLDVDEIWINTGTFRVKYTDDPSMLVTVTADTRNQILNDVILTANELEKEDFKVNINIFAGNKSDTQEATDWSYWGDTIHDTDDSTNVFLNFVKEINDSDIGLWIFDQINPDSTYKITGDLQTD